MTDLFESRRTALLYLLAWLCLGGFLAAFIVLARSGPWLNSLIFAFPLVLFQALGSAYSASALCRAFPLADKGLARILIVFVVASSLSGFFLALAAWLWNTFSENLEWSGAGIVFDPVIAVLIFGLGGLLYALQGIIHYLIVEFERSQAAQRSELESRLLAREAELRFLRSQVDPHFLFNSLNSISALTALDAVAARRMTLQLADFLRQSLRLAGVERIPLAEECAFVRQFLAIEQIRFGDRLRVEELLEPEALACYVPPLILQPLVENAVKHGIAGLERGGVLHLSAIRAGSLLRLSVDNEIDPDLVDREGAGLGLENVSQRLVLAYGFEAGMRVRREGARFLVEIEMPAQGEEEA